jgi:hypothetical protein
MKRISFLFVVLFISFPCFPQDSTFSNWYKADKAFNDKSFEQDKALREILTYYLKSDDIEGLIVSIGMLSRLELIRKQRDEVMHDIAFLDYSKKTCRSSSCLSCYKMIHRKTVTSITDFSKVLNTNVDFFNMPKLKKDNRNLLVTCNAIKDIFNEYTSALTDLGELLINQNSEPKE